MSVRDRQLGKFYVSAELVESGEAAELFTMMGFTALRCECQAYMDKYEYIGISHLFALVAEGLIIPTYKITIGANYNDSGEIVGSLTVIAEPI